MTHTTEEHECYWEKMKATDLARKHQEQETFRWAFYDIETTQAREMEDGSFSYLEQHEAVLIVLGKVITLY